METYNENVPLFTEILGCPHSSLLKLATYNFYFLFLFHFFRLCGRNLSNISCRHHWWSECCCRQIKGSDSCCNELYAGEGIKIWCIDKKRKEKQESCGKCPPYHTRYKEKELFSFINYISPIVFLLTQKNCGKCPPYHTRYKENRVVFIHQLYLPIVFILYCVRYQISHGYIM